MSKMDIAVVRALLGEIKEIAISSSMTGCLRKGVPYLSQMYNRCVTALQEQGDDLVSELFPLIQPENASIDDIGISASLLNAYLSTKSPERKLQGESLSGEYWGG